MPKVDINEYEGEEFEPEFGMTIQEEIEFEKFWEIENDSRGSYIWSKFKKEFSID